jgi:hypothetical protein
VHEGKRVLALEVGPNLCSEDANDLVKGWERLKQALPKAKATGTAFIDQFDGDDIEFIGPHLAVPNDTVARELKAR